MHKGDVVHTHTYCDTLHSHEKNRIMPFAGTWMGLETVLLSRVGQTEKDKYHDITYMWNLKQKKKGTNELIYKTKVES